MTQEPMTATMEFQFTATPIAIAIYSAILETRSKLAFNPSRCSG